MEVDGGKLVGNLTAQRVGVDSEEAPAGLSERTDLTVAGTAVFWLMLAGMAVGCSKLGGTKQ